MPSVSRPGEFSYENEHTGERIQWVPLHRAAEEEGRSPDLAGLSGPPAQKPPREHRSPLTGILRHSRSLPSIIASVPRKAPAQWRRGAAEASQ